MFQRRMLPFLRRRALLPYLAISLLFSGGCRPKLPLEDIQASSPRIAQVEGPETVVAGPYRLHFGPNVGQAMYMVAAPDHAFSHLNVDVRYRIERPEGAEAQLLLTTKMQNLGSHVGGRSYSYPKEQKPDGLDLLSIQSEAPLGWRGRRIVAKGELQELATVDYSAMFLKPKFEPAEEPSENNSFVQPLVTDFVGSEEMALGEGVSARVSRVPQHPKRLRVDLRWDPKQILPEIPGEKPLHPTAVCNVGSITWSEPIRDGTGEWSFYIVLQYNGQDGAMPNAMSLDVQFAKPVKRYPIHIPLLLAWE